MLVYTGDHIEKTWTLLDQYDREQWQKKAIEFVAFMDKYKP
jgi:hypothetical protein